MIGVVSMGADKAEVVVREPNGRTRTVHLRRSGNQWTNQWGTRFNLESGEVNWFIYYRDQLVAIVGNNRFKARTAVEGMTARQVQDFIGLVAQVVHEARQADPSLKEEV